MTDSSAFLQRIETVFHQVIAAPEDDRVRLMATLCAGDAELTEEVRSLLEASAEEERLCASQARKPRDDDAYPGAANERVGPYAIDRLIGRGGMGAVYLAHRADGNFDQQVAIKLIDRPAATEMFRERFRLERQILAGLNHPLIARLLDGGVTSRGDLYLVMEYVDGRPIHRYCNEKGLKLRPRLMLFKQLCEAVQFAHQQLVVHRDLKPDNVLVTEDGTPHLLDFGTAKLLSPSTEMPGSEFTRQGFQSFTPQYASPEQVLGNPITTASDTYSLGVLLYLLTTRALPYTLEDFTPAEMVRVICEQPPRRPSLVEGAGESVSPDLEAVLLKSLRKEPEGRYQTAVEFGADIQNLLDGRAVAARRGTLLYRAAKFVWRHRVAVSGAALLGLILATGVAAVLWQARVANAERRRAEARSADLRQLSNSLLSELDEAIKQLPGSTGAQHLLITRVLDHLDRMASDSKGDRTAQLDLIDAYTRLGNIEGNGYEQNLGDRSAALASIDKAIRLAQSLADSEPRDPQVLRALATAQGARGDILSETSDIQDSVASLQAEVRTYDRLIALPQVTPALYFEASTANSGLGDVVGQDTGLADVSAALAAYRKCLAFDARALALDPGFVAARRGMATMQMKVGNAELDIDPAQALQDFQLALQRFDALPAAEQNVLSTQRLRAITVRKVATAYSELGDYAHAVPLFEQAVAIHQRLADADPKDIRNLGDLTRALSDQAYSYEYAADPALAAVARDRAGNLRAEDQALERDRETLEKMMKVTPGDPDRQAELGNAQVRIGAVRWKLHQPGDAVQISRAGLDALRSVAMKKSASPHVLFLAATAFLQAQPDTLRDPVFAKSCAVRGVALTHGKTPEWLLVLAQASRAAGQSEESRSAAAAGLALLPAVSIPSHQSRVRRLLAVEALDGHTILQSK
ncbi:MAG TPA: protein kinase [Acidobacteriaceae bacterium]|jgi:tetratricopeptide (TPR) repeat protein|nr:protein kinase [Acidobacteriaceae bacterium]